MSLMRKRSSKTPAMAFNSGQRDHDSFYFTSTTPHFFKVLLSDAIQHGKLKIPAKFVRKYGSGISSPVFLKVPSGAIWQVKLTKSNAEMWLQSGWREFVEHHSLELHDFVVFRYEGNCLFNVVIFDKSASEIEYPINSCQTRAEIHNFEEHSQVPATEEDDDTSVEILDDMPPSKKRREKSPLPSPRPSRKMRIHSNTKRTESNATKVSAKRFEVPKRNRSSPWLTQGFSARGSTAASESNGGVNASQKQRHIWMQNTMKGKEKAKALQRASSFKSQNPFCRAVMQPSYVTNRDHFYMPLTFARQYLMKKQGKVLCVFDGKSWHMELESDSSNKKRFRPKLSNGWKEFSHDNNLDVGDVCVFELVKTTKITFNVVVFRSEVEDSKSLDNGNGASLVKSTRSLVTNYASKSKGNFNQERRQKTAGSQDGQGASSLRTLDVFPASSNFGPVPEDPNFKVVVRSCSLKHGSLHLPAAFAKRYIMPETRMVTLQVAERSWPVRLKSYSSKSFLTSGWTVFAKENSLREDDTCVFELINRSDAVLRVSIFKHEEKAGARESADRKKRKMKGRNKEDYLC
ncbi:B3 domain-containing transcription factor VRN1-like isoform X2 [Durio zibethinus]|uniref:B3 domain-containing transcription factor VRN1-like isoform X2 n=1 Tax=Durio zibethinus TaxID=66656 RepID=A0A6P6BAX6_DURZI|nr:B3 domain-containing transcription factor VRN1-like isoform X2 [Durio zibethinus]